MTKLKLKEMAANRMKKVIAARIVEDIHWPSYWLGQADALTSLRALVKAQSQPDFKPDYDKTKNLKKCGARGRN